MQSATLSMRQLRAGWLRVHHVDGRHTDIAELSEVAVFRELSVAKQFYVRSLRVTLDAPIDAVGIDIENEVGEKQSAEVVLVGDRWSDRPVDWVSASLARDGTVGVEVDGQALPAGVYFGQVRVRDAAGWHTLVSPRGDVVSIAIARGEMENEVAAPARLDRILDWLTHCHAAESWREGGVGATLTSRRRALAQSIEVLPGGRARLLSAALCDKWFEGGSTWMPPMNLLHDVPAIFEADMIDFHAAGDLWQGLATLSLKDLRNSPAFDPCALMGFANAASARASEAVELKNFSLNRLMAVLSALEGTTTDLPMGCRIPLLGVTHWLFSHLRLQDRIDETGFFGAEADSGNGNRSLALRRLHRALPGQRQQIPAPIRIFEDHRSLHADLSECLRSFSVAARQKTSMEWIGTTADTYGRTFELRDSSASQASVISALADLIRLAPELFCFHLLTAELEHRTAR
jgi:hypothetical protein